MDKVEISYIIETNSGMKEKKTWLEIGEFTDNMIIIEEFYNEIYLSSLERLRSFSFSAFQYNLDPENDEKLFSKCYYYVLNERLLKNMERDVIDRYETLLHFKKEYLFHKKIDDNSISKLQTPP